MNLQPNTKIENFTRTQDTIQPLSRNLENCPRTQVSQVPLSINQESNTKFEDTPIEEPDYYNMETQPLHPNKASSPEIEYDATQLFIPDTREELSFCINDTDTFNTKFWDDSTLDQLLLNDNCQPLVANALTGTDSSSPENVHISKRRKICLKLKKNDDDCDMSPPLLSQYDADNSFRKISLKNRKSRRKLCKVPFVI